MHHMVEKRRPDENITGLRHDAMFGVYLRIVANGHHVGLRARIVETDRVRIAVGTTRRGSIVARALVTGRSPAGTIFLPFHFAEAAANALTLDRVDSRAKIPDYKNTAVAIQKTTPPADWHEVSVDVVVPAEGADMLRVMIHVDGPCRVWVDDFQVAEVDAQGTARPIVRDGLPSQHQLYKQWIELYHGRGRPYLQFGVAIPPPTVEPTGAVEVGAFRAAALRTAAATSPGRRACHRAAPGAGCRRRRPR